ncbi:MAG: Metal dependent phosphohydrolase [Candidatus Saccharibacteria bacterium]|nr:Metal dependent phosphohydrolase [Candidatus Saccharibacteria bacterium]
MEKPDHILFELQKMSIDLALINRNHYLANTTRRENDIEHSFTIALLCWYIHDRYKIDLDIAKILKYALSHDFVERYAGDVNTFASTEDRQQKVKDEAAALARLSTEFSDFPDLVLKMANYELRQDDESLFVWTVDKMQQLIMGGLDNWRPYREISITFERFCDKYTEQLRKSSPYLRDIFDGLIEYSKATYTTKP